MRSHNHYSSNGRVATNPSYSSDPFKVEALRPDHPSRTPLHHASPNVPRGIVLHTHIFPSFARKIPVNNDGASEPVLRDSEKYETFGQFSAEVLLDMTYNGSKDRKRQICNVRISKPSPAPTRKCFTMYITCPEDDPFFHYMFVCTQFNFASIVQFYKLKLMSEFDEGIRMGTRLREGFVEGQYEREDEAFEKFNALVMERIAACSREPERYTAEFKINRKDRTAVLSFCEIIHGYRNAHLFSIDFKATPWDIVQKDVQRELERIKNKHSQVKTNLVNLVETVMKDHPNAFINSHSPTVVSHSQDWYSLIAKYMPEWLDQFKTMGGASSSTAKKTGPWGFSMAKDMMYLKQLFLLETERDVIVDEVYSKTVPLRVYYPNNPTDPESEDLIVTIWSKTRHRRLPHAYFLTIHSENNMFFHLTSVDITPSVFFEMTRGLDLTKRVDGEKKIFKTPEYASDDEEEEYYGGNGREEEEEDNVQPQPPKSLDEFLTNPLETLRREQITRKQERIQNDHERKRILGYHAQEGVGGVVGLIAGDFLRGCCEEPERCSAHFYMFVPAEPQPYPERATSPSSVPRGHSTRKTPLPNPTTPFPVHERYHHKNGHVCIPKRPDSPTKFPRPTTTTESLETSSTKSPNNTTVETTLKIHTKTTTNTTDFPLNLYQDYLQEAYYNEIAGASYLSKIEKQLHPPTLPPYVTAELCFMEDLGFKIVEPMKIQFKSTSVEIVREWMKVRINRWRTELLSALARLDSLLGYFRTRSPKTYIQLKSQLPRTIQDAESRHKIKLMLSKELALNGEEMNSLNALFDDSVRLSSESETVKTYQVTPEEQEQWNERVRQLPKKTCTHCDEAKERKPKPALPITTHRAKQHMFANMNPAHNNDETVDHVGEDEKAEGNMIYEWLGRTTRAELRDNTAQTSPVCKAASIPSQTEPLPHPVLSNLSKKESSRKKKKASIPKPYNYSAGNGFDRFPNPNDTKDSFWDHYNKVQRETGRPEVIPNAIKEIKFGKLIPEEIVRRRAAENR